MAEKMEHNEPPGSAGDPVADSAAGGPSPDPTPGDGLARMLAAHEAFKKARTESRESMVAARKVFKRAGYADGIHVVPMPDGTSRRVKVGWGGEPEIKILD